MDIRLEQYKVFYIAAKCGSFTEATKQLHITQSAISQQVRALEDELGAMLFARGRKGAKLTSHGELLFGYINRAMQEIESAEGIFERMKSLDEGSLKIGSGDTITRHFLLSKLEQFHNKYPGIKIEIVNRVTAETLSKLTSGVVDVAFVSLPIDKNKYSSIEVIQTESLNDIFIAGSNYSNLKNKTLSMAEIASLPLVMLEPKSNSRHNTDEYFKKHGIKLNPEFELGSHDLLIDFANKNLGIACVTEEFTDLNDDNEVFKLKTSFKMPSRNIGICTLKNVTPLPAVTKLIEMINVDQTT